jgi:hypothetical protein
MLAIEASNAEGKNKDLTALATDPFFWKWHALNTLGALVD